MEELIVEGLGGLGMVGISVLYTKWQTNQNKEDINKLSIKMNENEREDAIRDTKIAVIENQNSSVISRLDKMELTLEKIFDKIDKLK